MSPNTQAKATKGSPLRKGTATKLTSKANKGGSFVLRVHGFPPTGVEAYSLTLETSGGQGKEGYTYPVRSYVEGTNKNPIIQEILERGSFMACYYQRDGPTTNERKNGHDGWPRYWMIRNLPEGQTSSESSRREGLELLAALFKNKGVSKFPPVDIQKHDITGSTPRAMNHFFMDGDVMCLLDAIMDKDLLNMDFADSYPDFASVIFSGPNYPQEAIERLGYRPVPNPYNGTHGNYAPGFFPPGAFQQNKEGNKPASVGKDEENERPDEKDGKNGEKDDKNDTHKEAEKRTSRKQKK